MMQAQMEMQAQQQQQQPQSTFNPEEEQMKAEIEIAKKRAEIQAKLEADIALLTAKAGLESQDEEGMQEMPFTGSTEPMEEDFVNPDDEQEQPDMSDPESAGQNIMQMLSGTGGMQEQQPPMDQQQVLPQEDVGNTEGIEGIL